MWHTCKWCGKRFESSQANSGGVQHVSQYCCKRCENAGERARRKENEESEQWKKDHPLSALFIKISSIGILAVMGILSVVKQGDDKENKMEEAAQETIVTQSSSDENTVAQLFKQPENEINRRSEVQTVGQNNSLGQFESVENKSVVIDGTQLRLRLGPSTSAETFKWSDGTNRHPNVGDKFRYLDESGDFYKIDYNGCELWVSKQYTHIEMESRTNYSSQEDGFDNELRKPQIVENSPDSVIVEEDVEQEIFQIVEEMPTFPGGEAKLMEYIGQNIQYPQSAIETGVQGRVFVGFVVETDGSISNVKTLRGIGGGCDEEAERVVKSMPKWKPGRHHDENVRVSYMIPVNFKLQ